MKLPTNLGNLLNFMFMKSVFLRAEWRNLIMANYIVDPALLQPYLPYRTELDIFNGLHYISLVGFLFTNTRIHGFSFPLHTTFEEVNLRFYVRHKENGQWKRGVVFIKEMVPKRIITFVANTLYKEKYATHPMRHSWNKNDEHLEVSYYWKTGSQWNHMKVAAESEPLPIQYGTEAEFITEHYWGYTFIDNKRTGQYEVAHPQWRIHTVKSYDILCHANKLYGKDFAQALNASPRSVFLAEGSGIEVMKGTKRII